MKTYDFIFSNQLRHRLSRHLLFWLCWFLFMVLTYHIPMNNVFPNWDIKARMEFAQKRHGVDFITLRGGLAHLVWEIAYKQLRILLCQMAFTYSIIYYILPLYISGRKKWIGTTLKLTLLFIAFLALQYFVIWRNLVDSAAEWTQRGGAGNMPTPKVVLAQLWVAVFFNLATLVGIAVAIKLLKRWWLKQKETELIAREKLSAELQLLKAQVHPHFLFNSLNNIYSFTLEGSPRAPEMIQKLSDLLHYMLYECRRPLVPVEKEIKLIRDYISLERIRYGDRLKIDEQIQTDGNNRMIAPLLLIPFVENSFKHGTSKMLSRPQITIHISLLNNILNFKLTNSRSAKAGEPGSDNNRGLGLKNVRKRLTLLYPRRHALKIIDDPDNYTVWLKMALTGSGSPDMNLREIKDIAEYELV